MFWGPGEWENTNSADFLTVRSQKAHKFSIFWEERTGIEGKVCLNWDEKKKERREDIRRI
jgi:hypothetical protein